MSSSLVSGPYASAVSIKFTPSSAARLRTFSAFCRSAGQPQMRSPVTRIAPKPSRLTLKSPPKSKLGFVAMFADVDVTAPRITSDLPARSAAPLARVIPTNLRRVTLRSWFAGASSSLMTRRDPFMETVFDARNCCLSLAQQHGECLFEIFSVSHNAAFVSRHNENLAASHIGFRKQAYDFARHFTRAVRNALRSCRSAVKKRPPQY